MRTQDLRVVKTKKNLYNSLFELMKEKSFDNIKIKDICEKSLTNRSTFYDHFSNKYELLSSYINDLKDDVLKNIDIDKDNLTSKEYYMKLIELLLNHLDNNMDNYRLILKNNNNTVLTDMLYEALFKGVDDSISQNPNIPSEVVSNFYVSGVGKIINNYLIYPNKYDKGDILKYLNILIPNDI